MEKKKPLPPTYFLVALVLTVAVHFLVPLVRFPRIPWGLPGLLLLAAGISLNLWADQAMKKHETTVKPFEESTAMISGGVFGVSRNPMYLGMTAILLGLGLLLGSLSPLLVAAVFAVVMDRVFIVPEERMMEQTFGDRFREYRSRVRRWI